jgi:large-conductance mechanosensitive channel
LGPRHADVEGKIGKWRNDLSLGKILDGAIRTVDFVIIAFVIFLVVKQVNRLKKPAPTAVPTTKDCPQCLSTIPLKATKCAHCTSNV